MNSLSSEVPQTGAQETPSGVFSTRRLPELDAARGLAALMVAVHHGFASFIPTPGTRWFTYPVSMGWLGVDLFFVLSGFLITGILLDSRNRGDFFARFYAARLTRIMPLYYLSSIGLLLVVWVLGLHTEFRAWLYVTVFFGNLSSFLGFTLAGPMSVYWSLAVEEHFYLVWPLVVHLVKPRRLAWLAIAMVIVSTLGRVCFLTLLPAHAGALYSFTLTRLDGLALGALLAIAARAPNGLPVGKVAILFAAAGVCLLFGLKLTGHTARSDVFGGSLFFLGADLALAGAVGGLIHVSGLRSRRLAVERMLGFVGDHSYFLYLNHLVVFAAVAAFRVPLFGTSEPTLAVTLVELLLGLTATLLLAVPVRRWFELPLIARRDRLALLLARPGRDARALGH